MLLKVIYHPLYGMNNYVLIWGDWLSCDPLSGSHDSRSPQETLVPHLVATLIYLSQIHSYYIRGDRSPSRFAEQSTLRKRVHLMLTYIQLMVTCTAVMNVYTWPEYVHLTPKQMSVIAHINLTETAFVVTELYTSIKRLCDLIRYCGSVVFYVAWIGLQTQAKTSFNWPDLDLLPTSGSPCML